MIIQEEIEICPAYGWQGGPEFNTLIKQLRSGRERRRPLWGSVKHRYSLPFQNIRNNDYLQYLKSMFLIAHGSAYPFFAKDESDYAVENMPFGVGDGAETDFDLSMTYSVGAYSYNRKVLYPVSPEFYVNGVAAAATYNDTTKKVEFVDAPAVGGALSWSGEHRVLVRFESDALPMSIDTRSGGEAIMNGSVDLVEVWE